MVPVLAYVWLTQHQPLLLQMTEGKLLKAHLQHLASDKWIISVFLVLDKVSTKIISYLL